MDDLLTGLRWLAQGGRQAARELWEHRDLLITEELDEALEWLQDIQEGKEP